MARYRKSPVMKTPKATKPKLISAKVKHVLAGSSSSDSSSSDESQGKQTFYEVECIVAKRVKDGRKEYLLKWKNFEESQNTWEPEQNLECPKLIKEFEAREETKRKQTPVKRNNLKRSAKKITLK
jgi:hypothetical protein